MQIRFTLLLAALPFLLSAQITEPGTPPSFQPEWVGHFQKSQPQPVVLPPLNVAQAFQEDGQNPGQTRFAAPLSADISPQQQGAWTVLPNGERVWRCLLQSAGALGLVLHFDQFRLPAGAQFFAYSASRQQVFGAYTAQSMTPSGKFLIGVLPGESAWVEYREPAAAKGQGVIHIDRVDYAYDRSALYAPETQAENFGASLTCNVNINCPAGADWQTQKKGVARILMKFSNGSAWCSGTLIANTSGSPEPYFLTAHHCQIIIANATPDFSMWRFDFDYESATCTNPATEPARKSVLGCERVAFRAETDFLLLKTTALPSSYGLHFNGWNRSDAPSGISKSTLIHHPKGDIKKIAVDNDAAAVYPQSITWGAQFGTSEPNTHWKVVPDVGIYEQGSSGSPMFDQNKRIVGQLHGGVSNACTITAAYYGRFNISWNAGTSPDARLSDWLDPNNTGATTQDGYAQPAATNIRGKILTPKGEPLVGCRVKLTGGTTAAVLTDAQGSFEFSNIPVGGNYTLTPALDTMPLEGVSTYDLVLISKHILGLEPFPTVWKMLAADVNRSGSISTFDIVEARKLILGIYTKLPAAPSWRFWPVGTVFPDPTNPFVLPAGGNPLPEFISLTNLQGPVTTADFVAVKVGDVNDTALGQ
ncbi:MAG TPA: carboxypeptidase regulatory-like domain-containing protein [Saprospiraceae bacterium]|nr:carboxypeptidase regulatory-like domain-containing protein [Saprospiraceae bacterium]